MTADSHGANHTLCAALEGELADWNGAEGPLRCFDHMFNITTQAFHHAEINEVVDYAVEKASAQADGEQGFDAQLPQAEDVWLLKAPLQKVVGFVKALRKNDRLCNHFRRDAGRSIRSTVNTLWNSHLATFEHASALRDVFTQFALQHSEHFGAFEMSSADWQVIECTVVFPTPLKEATKAYEGDNVTLDKVQLRMESLTDHFQGSSTEHAANSDFNASAAARWYALDKYYKLMMNSALMPPPSSSILHAAVPNFKPFGIASR